MDGDILYKCFLEAFSDYQVPIAMDRRTFDRNNTLRGFAPELSVGVFREGRLVGFIMSGEGVWLGKATAYDMGTGVVPACRGRGLARALLQGLRSQLDKHAVRCYLLEVLKTNTPAFSLYKKDGFAVTRGFLCFRVERESLLKNVGGSVLSDGLVLRRLSEMPESGPEFCDWPPSWQNSTVALRRYPGPLEMLGVFHGGELVACGVAKPAGGDIPQLAVRKDFRRRGIGRFLLSRLVAALPEKKTISLINIDEADTASRNFFQGAGFSLFTEQFEMLKTF